MAGTDQELFRRTEVVPTEQLVGTAYFCLGGASHVHAERDNLFMRARVCTRQR